MTLPNRQNPVFRFAPSPNGPLHLGHALSALLNHDLAKESGGTLLLRIEDIDPTRCNPHFEAGIYANLEWLGILWRQPVRRQSEHFDTYREVLDRLIRDELVYPAFMTRGEVRAYVETFESTGQIWPRDPDGSPLYPPTDRWRSSTEARRLIDEGRRHAWRLDMGEALSRLAEPLTWVETGDADTGILAADPAGWGDVVLSRSDAPSSYHLSVVVDDGLQGVSHVVRGLDLFAATAVHRLLQTLLGLPAPLYRHHRLILDAKGCKLSKSQGSTGLQALRARGFSPSDIRALVGR